MAKHLLTAMGVKRASQPGRYRDGGGLSLLITEDGKKRWELRIRVDGRQRQLGLGTVGSVTLEGARAKADAIRERVRLGQPAITDREVARARVAKAGGPQGKTVKAAFDEFWSVKENGLSNARVRQQWPASLRDYAFPAIGDMLIADVKPSDVEALLKPIWTTKGETARRVEARLRELFHWAIFKEYRAAANPVVGIKTVLGRRAQRGISHPALPYILVPEMIRHLHAWRGHDSTKLALEFLTLTAARGIEVRMAVWAEFDVEARLWTIPPHRMKQRRQHVVPLCDRAVAIYRECRARWGHQPLVFIGIKQGRPLSENALNNALAALGLGVEATGHGLRATFRTWCSEVDKTRPEVAEAALAHVTGSATQQAYDRATYLDERAALMARWAAFALNG